MKTTSPWRVAAVLGTVYNAWTIAHFGMDQFGNHFPLFFLDSATTKAGARPKDRPSSVRGSCSSCETDR